MPFSDLMHTYFRGERIESLYFLVPYGVLCLAFAVVAIRAERNAFGWGLAIPMVLMALVAIGVGGGVGVRTPAQVAALDQVLAQEGPAAVLAIEQPRMAQVNHNWGVYLSAYAVAIALGAGLRFGLRADLAHGLGIGLIFFGASGLIIDGFAERRARIYTQALDTLAGGAELRKIP